MPSPWIFRRDPDHVGRCGNHRYFVYDRETGTYLGMAHREWSEWLGYASTAIALGRRIIFRSTRHDVAECLRQLWLDSRPRVIDPPGDLTTVEWEVRLFNSRQHPDGHACGNPVTVRNWPDAVALAEALQRRDGHRGNRYEVTHVSVPRPVTNMACPSRCNREHEVPDGERGEHFMCPTTGRYWRWCEHDNHWAQSDRYMGGVSSPQMEGDDPDEGGQFDICNSCFSRHYAYCYDCSVAIVRSEAIVNRGHHFCGTCGASYQNCDEHGVRRTLCPTCNTYNDYLDEIQERFVCLHEAEERMANRVPVLVPA